MKHEYYCEEEEVIQINEEEEFNEDEDSKKESNPLKDENSCSIVTTPRVSMNTAKKG
jgi:hypothetical protein